MSLAKPGNPATDCLQQMPLFYPSEQVSPHTAAAGIRINWDDFSELSSVVPELARIYPNGKADVNHFHAAGGLGFTIKTLLDGGLLHREVETIMGPGLERFCQEPVIKNASLQWVSTVEASLDAKVLRPVDDPFQNEGGLKLVKGNLGRAIIKSSAVKPKHQKINAPARVFDSQQTFADAFNRGDFTQDTVVVLTHQGPSANGMPELHKLIPYLAVLQSSGLHVALLTDGRLSGASVKVLAAIHVTPDTLAGGALGKVQDGDLVTIDAQAGLMNVDVSDSELDARRPAGQGSQDRSNGMGRELFDVFRAHVGDTERGATILRGLGS